jgi:hypothetical protein
LIFLLMQVLFIELGNEVNIEIDCYYVDFKWNTFSFQLI